MPDDTIPLNTADLRRLRLLIRGWRDKATRLRLVHGGLVDHLTTQSAAADVAATALETCAEEIDEFLLRE